MSASELARLGLLAFVAVTLVVSGDTAGKLLTEAGVAPAFAAWSRFALAVMILAPMMGVRAGEWRNFLNFKLVFRGCLISGGISCILMALKTEPIANVYGAFFIGPVVSYVLAVIFLGERPELGRSLALAVGFIGVMLVVKPGFGLSRGIGFALGAGCCYGTYLMMTRWVAPLYRPRFLLFSQLLIGTVILAPTGLGAWPEGAGMNVWALVAASAAASAAGNYLLVVVNQKAEASLIAPLVYSQLISATVLGVWVFGDWPDALSLTGLGLILASGGAALWLAQRTVR